jgi:hypothetical protein
MPGIRQTALPAASQMKADFGRKSLIIRLQ